MFKRSVPMISILCADTESNYYRFPGLDIWDKNRDAYYFTGSNPVIVHPPCAQWSRLKGLSKPNPDEKELAFHCLKYVIRNGGIFEHPNGSYFFKEVGISEDRIYTIDQNLFGFPARKTTKLFFNGYSPGPLKSLYRVDHIKNVGQIPSRYRSRMTEHFCRWLLRCIDPDGFPSIFD